MNATKTSVTCSTKKSVIKLRILIVDDDKICLAVAASVLKLFNYEVVTTNCPLEALSTLRVNNDSFDLILSDVHMPLMNGLHFQRIVGIEFQIPVILMSADDQKDLLMKSLECGAAFFFIKPPNFNDLKNVWQYVISKRKSVTSSIGKEAETCFGLTNNDVYPKAPMYANNEHLSSDHQNQSSTVESEDINDKKNCPINQKKPKLIWTTTLHNKFLEAISVIGNNRAVPKKIMEYMNIPGLTRENIASHLQKYRIYVRRLNDSNGSMQHGMPLNWNERPFRSSFSWSQFPTLADNSHLLRYSNAINLSNQQGIRTTTTTNHDQLGENMGFNKSSYNNGTQELSFVNSQPSPFSQANNSFVGSSINNLNTNYVHDDMPDYNNLNRSMNILESSMLDHGQNIKNNYDLGMIRNASDYEARTFGLNPHQAKPDAMASHGPHRPYFHGGFGGNVTDSNTQGSGLLRQPTHIHSSFDNNVFREQLNNIASFVPLENKSNVNNNKSAGIILDENKANATLQSQVAQDKDITTSNGLCESSAPQRDNNWAPNHLDDFPLEYGIEDLSTILAHIDAQNGKTK